MKPSIWIPITLLVTAVASIELQPFTTPTAAGSPSRRAFEVLQILRRADNCPSGYSDCSNEGNSDVCCKSGTVCTRDAADNIACCSTGASCTGTLGSATTTTTGTDTSSSFRFTQTDAATTTTSDSTTSTITGSTLSGAAYPFIVLPTTFSNAQTCSSYYSLCQSEYTACTASLVGRYGVTVAGSGGGITVAGATGTSAAVSICSSLSLEACHDLHLSNCAAYGTATTGAYQVGGAAAARQTAGVQDLVLGLAVGVAGMFI
ncbi:hypothetical protein ASPZODRAFT_61042 [Penicilliopsis zonata CBS 506.65]|uniref:Hydrophobin n=1 Tax=Penicilliopsis zonata CBS 506.65 TaxID=1073090 RepID=A0A1L9SQC0_9EURO|nr:hypothetical protein ASPZODRAFT_61042 [Penicilliopsis zonata CBS 506.65]OJJ49358.1 hypothetical protein ASPZODRAFT_61042 [Penicilliopsis zonata CBS 506.65]